MAEEPQKPIAFVNPFSQARPHHWGKWIVHRGFNDTRVVAYGKDFKAARRNAEAKGIKIVGHVSDPPGELGIVMYCPYPCEWWCSPAMKYVRGFERTDKCPPRVQGVCFEVVVRRMPISGGYR